MSELEFMDFQKIARFSRDVVVTEKIDGTNAQVLIAPLAELTHAGLTALAVREHDGDPFGMLVGSRSRYITETQDNHGFAKWAKAHADELFGLGAGRHFGEWWGSGIQRGYGLPPGEKCFSLFNVARWHRATGGEVFVTPSLDPRQPARVSTEAPVCCNVVPVLWRGRFESFAAQTEDFLDRLRESGSLAAPGFMRPEGVVIYHTAGNVLFKKTLDKDDEPKRMRQSV